jgi:hypothetical protein
VKSVRSGPAEEDVWQVIEATLKVVVTTSSERDGDLIVKQLVSVAVSQVLILWFPWRYKITRIMLISCRQASPEEKLHPRCCAF